MESRQQKIWRAKQALKLPSLKCTVRACVCVCMCTCVCMRARACVWLYNGLAGYRRKKKLSDGDITQSWDLLGHGSGSVVLSTLHPRDPHSSPTGLVPLLPTLWRVFMTCPCSCGCWVTKWQARIWIQVFCSWIMFLIITQWSRTPQLRRCS